MNKYFNFIKNANSLSRDSISITEACENNPTISEDLKFQNYSEKKSIFSYQKSEDLFKLGTLIIFQKNNFFRKICCKIIENYFFNLAFYFMIALSSIRMAGETFINIKSSRESIPFSIIIILYYCKITTNLYFTFEALLKIVSNGLYFGDNPFLKDFLNCLNFLATVGYYANFLIGNKFPIFKVGF